MSQQSQQSWGGGERGESERRAQGPGAVIGPTVESPLNVAARVPRNLLECPLLSSPHQL